MSLFASEPKWEWGIAPSFDLYLTEESEFYRYGHDGSCGKHLNIQSFEFPLGNPNFDLTWTYELSDQGEKISKWPIPNDTSTYAVAGDVLTVSTTDEHQPYFDINYSGQIVRSIESELSNREPEFVECPVKNRYEACVRLFDATQSSYRIITTLSACT